MRASTVCGLTSWDWGLGFLDLLPGLGEVLVRSMEEFACSTYALEARVFLHLMAYQGEVGALFVEHLARQAQALYRCIELVRCVSHDVVRARLRQSVHEAWYA